MKWPFRREPELTPAQQAELGRKFKKAADKAMDDAGIPAAAGDEQEQEGDTG